MNTFSTNHCLNRRVLRALAYCAVLAVCCAQANAQDRVRSIASYDPAPARLMPLEIESVAGETSSGASWMRGLLNPLQAAGELLRLPLLGSRWTSGIELRLFSAPTSDLASMSDGSNKGLVNLSARPASSLQVTSRWSYIVGLVSPVALIVDGAGANGSEARGAFPMDAQLQPTASTQWQMALQDRVSLLWEVENASSLLSTPNLAVGVGFRVSF